MLLAIVIGIITFLILVIIHEFWHFIAAKRSWVKVLEFGIWIPPKLFTFYKDKSWTEYTLNLLPLWWFVRLKWESPDNPNEFLAKDSFITQNIWKKSLILVWWVLMNLIFAYILFVIAFIKWVSPLWIYPYGHSESILIPSADYIKEKWWLNPVRNKLNPQVYYVLSWSVADKIWIKTWDIILSVNWQQISFIWNELKNVIKQNCWRKINIKIKRDDQILDLYWYLNTWSNCVLWVVALQQKDFKFPVIKFDIPSAFYIWAKEIYWEIKITFVALWNLVKKLLSFNKQEAKEAISQFSGPVWAVKVWEVILYEYGIWQYFAFAAMISLALAIFNILPIPALDGWRLVSVWIQTILKLDPVKYFSIENWFNILFFIVLLLLGVYIIILDLQRFWGIW